MHLNRDEFAHAQRAAGILGTHRAITHAVLPASAEQVTTAASQAQAAGEALTGGPGGRQHTPDGGDD